MKFTTKVIHKVNYNDFDKAINEFLEQKGGKPYEFEIVAHHKLGNDMSKTFSVGLYDQTKIDDYDKAEILKGDLDYRGDDILEWMHEEGLIPAGEYLVKISW
jgi:hypothetical protein